MDTPRTDTQKLERVRLARIALATLVEPGEQALHDLVTSLGPDEALAAVTGGAAAPGLVEAARRRLRAGNPWHVAEDVLTRGARLGVRVVIPEDDEWPIRLDALATAAEGGLYPPVCLWACGPQPLTATLARSVALVGSRAATSYGVAVATELGYDLATRGWVVAAGGSFGVEAAAHRGALAGGGMTVAVLPCGLDRPHPAAHASLFAQIRNQGTLISPYPPGREPHRVRFEARTRLLAALAAGTVLVEATARSGSQQALGTAAALGRAVMAVPGPVTSAMSVGCHQAIRDGARLVTGHQEVLDEITRVSQPTADEQPSGAEAG